MRIRALIVALVMLFSIVAGPVAAQETVTLTVSVVDDSGNAVGGAELTASWDGGETTRTTAGNGKAFLDVPEDETVTVTVSHPDFIRNRPFVIEDVSEQEVTINVAKKGSADISVIDENGPVEGARVILSQNGREVVRANTDSDGLVDTDTIERGEYRISVFKAGYYTGGGPLSVTGDINREYELERGSVTVQFVVADDHFDPARPIEDARVTVGGSTVTTLGNGEATLQIPVNTAISATVTKDGYTERTVDVTIPERSRTYDVNINREPSLHVEAAQSRIVVGENVRLEVTDEYGDLVSGATITLDGEAVGETNDQGVLVTAIESAGDHELVATTDGLESEPITVEGIEASEQTTTTAQTTTEQMTTETTEQTTTNVGLPGFTVLTAVLSVLVVSFLLRRRV
ncbi:hypothetical protein [Haladaptatus sp. CMSO5]|uniref:hypothetical protein n=1 Tax=Haladaptatus sp. CMSO5 TaxID=3120514 RepID=UPI002FCE1C3B